MTKRTINARLLAILVLLLALGGGVAFLAHALQMRRHADTLMAQAHQAEIDGQSDQQLRYLQRYLVFAPQDNTARARCGELVEQLAVSDHERWRAVDVYEQVLYREPSRQDIRRRLAQLALRLGWLSEAQNHLQILVREQPGQADLQRMLGQCQEESGDYARAAASYQHAIRNDPHQVDAFIRLAQLFRTRLDQPEQTGRVLDDLVRNNPRSVEAYLVRAAYRLRQAALTEAAKDVECARKLAPEDARVLLLDADLARCTGRFEDARRVLHKGCEQQPKNLALHLALAQLELQTDHKREAAHCLQQALRSLPDQAELQLVLAETLVDLGEEAAVEQIIERLQRPGSPPGLSHHLKGRLQLQRKEWNRALRTLEEVAQSKEIAPVLAARANLCLARCQEELGERERQLAALRKAVAFDPTFVAARIALAETLRSRGRIEEAEEQLREVVRLPQAPDHAWILLGRLLVQRNRSLPPRKRSTAEIEQVLERAGKLPTVAVPLLLLRAEVLAERGQQDEARNLLEKAVAAHPDQPSLLAALADLAGRQGKPEQALQLLEQARPRLSNPSELLEAEIALMCRQQPRQARQSLRKMEKELERLPAAERFHLLGQMAAVCFRIGEREEGLRFGRLLRERAPADLPSHRQLLDLALQAGEETLLADITADLRRIEGEEGTWWRYAEASRLLLKSQHGDSPAKESARALTTDIARRRPDWPRVALLQAYLHEMDGEPEGAANAYLRAYMQGENAPGLAERLVQLLVEQGRLDEADEVIRIAQQREQPSANLARLGTEIALRQRKIERALELAGLAVAKETADYAQLLWLGQALAQAGRADQGEEVLRRAVGLRDDLAETWLALIAHLAKQNQQREAEDVREEMRRRLPTEQRPLALAIAAEVLDQWHSAAEQYRQSVARTPNDVLVLQRAAQFYLRLGRSEQAEPLLRRMIAPRADMPEIQRIWARRQLALLLAFSRPDCYGEAMDLLQDNPKSLLDERARLLVQATRREQRRASLRLLEKSGKMQPFTSEELFCLVRLYEIDNDKDAAEERMLDLLALDRNNPEYLAHHIDRLLKRSRRDEARAWIKRLQKLEPDSSRVQRFTHLVGNR